MIFVENNAINNRPISPKKEYNTINNFRPVSSYINNTFRSTLKSTESSLYGNNSPRMGDRPTPSITVKNRQTSEDINAHFDFHKQEDYIKFIGKDTKNEEKMTEFYKKKRKEITGHLVELTKDDDSKKNKLEDVKIYNKKNFTHSPRARSPRIKSHYETSNNFSNTEMNNFYIENKKDNYNVFAMVFPYVRGDEFPKPVEKHVKLVSIIQIMGTGFEKEKRGKEVIKVDLFRKSTNNFNEKFKKYDKDLNSFATKVKYINL